MKFVCLGYYDEEKWKTIPEGEQNAFMDECFAYDDVLREGGHSIGGEAVQPARNAKTLRFQNGKVMVTDGPYAETKEQVGGFFLLEAEDLKHAIQLMSRHPGVKVGPFEIRPVEDMTEMIRESERRRSITTQTTQSAKRMDLLVTRVFDVPVELAWKAWSDPNLVMEWWGPNAFTCPSAEMDFREGGTSLVCMRAPKWLGGQDMYSTWHYRKIVPLERIEYIHNLADKDGNKVDPVKIGMPPDFPQDLRNAVVFKALGDHKTEITVTEYDWPVGQRMEMSKQGLEQCLDKMAASLASA